MWGDIWDMGTHVKLVASRAAGGGEDKARTRCGVKRKEVMADIANPR
jgi:hypothetical protein